MIRLLAFALTAVALETAVADTWGRYKIVGTYMTDASDGVEGVYPVVVDSKPKVGLSVQIAHD